MILFLAYIINLFAPAINLIGLLGLCGCVVYEDFYVLVIAAMMFVAGLFFGRLAYGLDIPPRWFWAKSRNQLFSFTVTAVLGYAWSFAMWPCAIYLVSIIIKRI